MAYLHPLAGLGTVAVLFYAASLGLRGRTVRRDADRFRRLHARVAPLAYACVALNWVAGITSVWALRPELDLASSSHFTLGCLIVTLLTAAALASRALPSSPTAGWAHPALGAGALLLCGAQVFFGLRMTP